VSCEAFGVAGLTKVSNIVYRRDMYYVYIIQSEKDNSYYTGYTSDLRKQFKKHNEGAQKYTTQKKPFRLIWYCGFVDQKKANAFERYLKQGSGFAFARKHLV